jgi:uncharacterized protein (TIGR00730 family)
MNVCVFCGSSTGQNPLYASAASEFGKQLGLQNHALVYGGGNIGLMGIIADAVLENGGKVVGVIPTFLADLEVAHKGITQLEIVGTMHERKMRMAALANAFVALPGGWGTLDELAEILTWKQLGLVQQPCIILNINNFFNPLLSQMNLMVREGFLRDETLKNLKVAYTISEALRMIP